MGSFPLMSEIVGGYNDYLATYGIRREPDRGFQAKLINGVSSRINHCLNIGRKQCDVDGVRSSSARVFNWRKKDIPSSLAQMSVVSNPHEMNHQNNIFSSSQSGSLTNNIAFDRSLFQH